MRAAGSTQIKPSDGLEESHTALRSSLPHLYPRRELAGCPFLPCVCLKGSCLSLGVMVVLASDSGVFTIINFTLSIELSHGTPVPCRYSLVLLPAVFFRVFRPMGWAPTEMAWHGGLVAGLFPSQSCFSRMLQISSSHANHKVPRLHTEPGTIHAWLGAERWQDFLAHVAPHGGQQPGCL